MPLFSKDVVINKLDSVSVVIMKHLNSRNMEDLLNLAMTSNQFRALIESFEEPKKKKKEFLADFNEEMFVGIRNNISKGMEQFDEILLEADQPMTMIEKIEEQIYISRFMPLETGRLEIYFKTNGQNYKVSSEMINTLDGWRIFDDFGVRLVTD